MTEFQPVEPAMRLFDEIDLAPAPRSASLQRVLGFWREQRADRLLPSAAVLERHLPGTLAPDCFIFSSAADDQSFRLEFAGQAARDIFGCHESGVRLSKIGNRRLAVFARHLFNFALKRQEAVSGQFTLGARGRRTTSFEMLAAPAGMEGDGIWIFGAVAAD